MKALVFANQALLAASITMAIVGIIAGSPLRAVAAFGQAVCAAIILFSIRQLRVIRERNEYGG